MIPQEPTLDPEDLVIILLDGVALGFFLALAVACVAAGVVGPGPYNWAVFGSVWLAAMIFAARKSQTKGGVMAYNHDAALFAGKNRNRAYDAVIAALEKVASDRKIRGKDIAEKIGCSEAHLIRMLSSPSNWTLDTISDLLFAIDAEMDFNVVLKSGACLK